LKSDLWKTVGGSRKRLVQPDARHFPMACGGVFSGRAGDALPVAARRMVGPRKMLERLAICDCAPNKIRKLQRARACNMPERVAAHIAIVGCVGKLADAYAIEHYPDDPLKLGVPLPHDPLRSGWKLSLVKDCTPRSAREHLFIGKGPGAREGARIVDVKSWLCSTILSAAPPRLH